MTEIRRVTQEQAPAVAAIWDRMCTGTPDGGPLTPQGRTNIERMVAMAAFHHQTACLVAVDGADVVGFVLLRADAGDGLLPCLAGEVQELYAVPEVEPNLADRLADAAVAWLREREDLWTIRVLRDAEDTAGHDLWRRRGFVADMVVLSQYRDG